MAKKAWKRVMIKLSGEALMGSGAHGLDEATLARIANDIKSAARGGAQIAIVVGGGNFFRGIAGAEKGIDRARADSIGMLATIMNGLALEHAIEKAGQPARTLSAVPVPYVCQPYSRQAALNHMNKGRVAVLSGGTGNPFFTTDTAAALRAVEMNCQALLKATQVDGVYDADPKKNPGAKRYDRLTFDKVIADNLQVMDTAAIALARENKLPIEIGRAHV